MYSLLSRFPLPNSHVRLVYISLLPTGNSLVKLCVKISSVSSVVIIMWNTRCSDRTELPSPWTASGNLCGRVEDRKKRACSTTLWYRVVLSRHNNTEHRTLPRQAGRHSVQCAVCSVQCAVCAGAAHEIFTQCDIRTAVSHSKQLTLLYNSWQQIVAPQRKSA